MILLISNIIKILFKNMNKSIKTLLLCSLAMLITFASSNIFSNIMASSSYEEIYPLSYEEEGSYSSNEYSNDDGYEKNSYDPYKDNIKKDHIVKIEKKLFICENVKPNTFFQCVEGQFSLASPPGSVRYLECNEQLCPLVDESDFSVQLFKDVATIHDLSPQGTLINLDKLHYTVTEGFISDRIGPDNLCKSSGFSHSSFKQQVLGNMLVSYSICINYVGDCEGTINPGEVKTCTIENYIYSGSITIRQTTNAIDDDDNGATPTGTTTSQSNNTIPTTTTTTTQSSNVIGAPQSNSLGIPNTFSFPTASSSLLGNILSSNPN